MPANTAPVYSLSGNVATNNTTGMPQGITAVVTDYDGSGANNVLLFTAGANGSYIERIRLKAKGTNAAAVARFYLNNGSANTTPTNNAFYGEVSLPATTAITTAATAEIDYQLGFAIPAGFRLYVGISAVTTLAAGWVATPIAGNY